MAAPVNNSGIKLVFSQNITMLMKEKNRSRREVCSDLNLKYTTLCDWVNGRAIPHGEQLEKLGRYFDIEISEFFIEHRSHDRESEKNRMDAYSTGIRRLDMKVIDHMSDEQIRELIRSGYSFEHKTLEEYIDESGGAFVPSGEVEWDEPVGREIW